jgi:hypothetical protein
MSRKRPPNSQPVACTAEIFEAICKRIGNGENLHDICDQPGMPHASTIYSFMAKSATETAARYAYAREQQAMHTETAVARTIAKVEDGKLSPDQGRVVINGLTWLAKIRDPKTYGDKMEHKHGGEVGFALTVAPYTPPRQAVPDQTDSFPLPVIDVGPRDGVEQEPAPYKPRPIRLPELYLGDEEQRGDG